MVCVTVKEMSELKVVVREIMEEMVSEEEDTDLVPENEFTCNFVYCHLEN